MVDSSSLKKGNVYFICGFHDPMRRLPFIQTVVFSGTKHRSDGGTDLIFQPAENCIPEAATDGAEPHPPLAFDVAETNLICDATGLLGFVDEYSRS